MSDAQKMFGGTPLQKPERLGKQEIFRFARMKGNSNSLNDQRVHIHNRDVTWSAIQPMTLNLHTLFHGADQFYVMCAPYVGETGGRLYFLAFVEDQHWPEHQDISPATKKKY